jgi:hypothetical protein
MLLLGFASYRVLTRRLAVLGHPKSLRLHVLPLFVSYGGLVMILLTGMFWRWSGAASLGFLYLVTAAPLLHGFTVWKLWPRRTEASAYRMIVWLAGGFCLIVATWWLGLFIASIK